jgi:hypothetical protein
LSFAAAVDWDGRQRRRKRKEWAGRGREPWTALPPPMGRRGQTGSHGAVVSSISSNSGGTVKRKENNSRDGEPSDAGVEIVFEGAAPRRKPRHADASAAHEGAGSASSVPGAVSTPAAEPKSAGWIGKTPTVLLTEWCTKNDRKRPS